MYDLLIVGAGPCGITAAIYAVRNRLKTAVISKDIGGQMAWSGVIENYSGFSSLKGPELTKEFENHAKSLDVDLIMDSILEISKEKNIFKVKTKDSTYESKAVIVASGKNPKKLNVPGEEKYLNRGVVYCATCDGPLFANRVVAIVGGGNSALDAAAQLMKIAKKVYIINKNSEMKGDQLLFEKVNSSDRVEIIYNALTKEIKGERRVKSIVFDQNSTEKEIEVEGVFVQIGLLPNSGFVNIVKKNEYGEILVDDENRTNVKGLFAAGDVTQIFEKQIIIAAGDGSKASLSAFKYISKLG